MFHSHLCTSGLVSVVSQAFFAVGVALLSLLAYFVQDDWRHLTQGATLLGIPFVFLIAFVLPESHRWLQSQGRTEAAVKVMQHIAAKNGAQWSSEIVTPAAGKSDKPAKKQNSSTSDTLASLLNNKEVNQDLVVMCFFIS